MNLLDLQIGDIICNKDDRHLNYYKLVDKFQHYYLFVGWTNCYNKERIFLNVWTDIAWDEFEKYHIVTMIPNYILDLFQEKFI